MAPRAIYEGLSKRLSAAVISFASHVSPSGPQPGLKHRAHAAPVAVVSLAIQSLSAMSSAKVASTVEATDKSIQDQSGSPVAKRSGLSNPVPSLTS